MRVVVAHPRPADPSAPGIVPVGLVRRPAPEAAISVVVKVTFTYAAEDGGAAVLARLAAAQEPLSLSVASRLSQASARELFYASDFVLEKPRSDVLLVGHAFAGEPTCRIRAGLTTAGVTRQFTVVTSEPAPQIPLSQGHLRAKDDDDQRIDPVGPLAPERALPPVAWDDDDDDDGDDDDNGLLDEEQAQSATPLQRGEPIRSTGIIELVGLSAREPRLLVELPGLSPRVFDGHGAGARPLDLRGDTLWIDTDRELIVVSWRGRLHAPAGGADGLSELLVSLERDAAPRTEALWSAVPRASFAFAVEEEDVRTGSGPPEMSPEDISMARYSAWGDTAPAPTIPLTAYAAISAELAEGRESRAAVLSHHELDEDSWTIEERAWLEAMGDAAMEGDGTMAATYGELFVLAQDRLADPAEDALGLDDYIALRIAVEAADDPPAVLKERGTTLSAWMRLDRRWMARAEADPRLREEIERRLEMAPVEVEEAPSSEEEA